MIIVFKEGASFPSLSSSLALETPLLLHRRFLHARALPRLAGTARQGNHHPLPLLLPPSPLSFPSIPELPDLLDNLAALLDFLALAMQQNNHYLVSILIYVLSITDLSDQALQRLLAASFLPRIHSYLHHQLEGKDPVLLSGSNLTNILYYTLGFIDRYLDKPRTLRRRLSSRIGTCHRHKCPNSMGSVAPLRRRSHARLDTRHPSGPRRP